MEQSTKHISDKKPEKRKVKRVDYTLKLTSNDIERSNPPKEEKSKHPISYKIGAGKAPVLSNGKESPSGAFNK